MRFTKLKLLMLLSLAPAARGNEHGAPAAAEAAVAQPRDQKEFVEKTLKLAGLAAKLEEAEKQFAAVVHEKQEAATPEAKFPYLKEMVEIAKQRNANVIAYNKLKTELTLRYPNQGEHLNRHAHAPVEHSVEELEHQVTKGPSLDELLVETKRLIDQKYGTPTRARQPAAVLAPTVPKAPRLRLER